MMRRHEDLQDVYDMNRELFNDPFDDVRSKSNKRNNVMMIIIAIACGIIIIAGIAFITITILPHDSKDMLEIPLDEMQSDKNLDSHNYNDLQKQLTENTEQENVDENVNDSMDSKQDAKVFIDIENMDFAISEDDNVNSYDLHAKFEHRPVFVCDKTEVVKVREGDGKWDVADSLITIREGGEYFFQGQFTGQILVECNDDEVVQLVFNGFNIVNDKGPAILIEKAKKAIITFAYAKINIAGGPMTTENISTESKQKGYDAVIYSKSDLTVNGWGDLSVLGYVLKGIHSERGVTLVGYDGFAFISSGHEDGIVANDFVKVTNMVGGPNNSNGSGIYKISSQSKSAVIVENKHADPRLGFISLDNAQVFATSIRNGFSAATYFRAINSLIDHSDEVWGVDVDKTGKENGNAIYSNGDIVITDSNVTTRHQKRKSFGNGLVAKREILFDGDGKINLQNTGFGMKARRISIKNGNVNVDVDGDGMLAVNDSAFLQIANDGTNPCFIDITGGNVSVAAGGYCFKSDENINITGGIVKAVSWLSGAEFFEARGKANINDTVMRFGAEENASEQQ